MFCLLFIGFDILSNPGDVLKCIIFSVDLFKNSIFPSLFPFFVLSHLPPHSNYILTYKINTSNYKKK